MPRRKHNPLAVAVHAPAPVTAPAPLARRNLNESEKLLISACLSVFKPRSHTNIADWIRAQKIRVSSEQNSALAGTYFDPDQTPAVARLLHGFYEAEGSDVANVMVLLKDSQSGATTNLASVIPWIVETRPGNAAYWTDTGLNVYAAVEEKFKPFFKACSSTRNGSEERDSADRTLKKNFAGMSMTFMGSGSPASFKQRTITYCVLDECGGHRPINGQTTLDLAIARTTTETDARTLAFSKPGACISTITNEDGETSITSGEHEGDWFHAAYLSGTQEKYQVPCPHCGHFQEMKWENLHYLHCQEVFQETGAKYWNEARILNETYYLCDSRECREGSQEGKILDIHRPVMMKAGKWVPTVGKKREYYELFPSARPRWRSAQHSALLSLFPNLSFGNLALEHKATLNDPAKARAFLNERGGAPYKPETAASLAEASLLTKLIPDNKKEDHSDYHRLNLQTASKRRLRLPRAVGYPPLVGMTCDVQKAFFKWMVWAFMPVEDRMADYGEGQRYRGVPAAAWCLDWGKSESITDLDEIFGNELVTHDGLPRPIDYLIMDARTPAQILYGYCAERYPRWFPLWGDARPKKLPVSVGTIWQTPHAMERGGNINVVHIDPTFWSEEARIRRIDRAILEEPSMTSPPFRFPPEIRDDRSFMEEILNQQAIRSQNKDGIWNPIKWGPVQNALKDDYFDCCKWAAPLWKLCSHPDSVPVVNGWKDLPTIRVDEEYQQSA